MMMIRYRMWKAPACRAAQCPCPLTTVAAKCRPVQVYRAGVTVELERVGRLALGGATLLVLAIVAVRYGGGGTTPPVAAPAAAVAGPAPAAGIGMLEAQFAARPGDASTWATLGQQYFAAARYADAARADARATTIDPGQAANWSALGEAMVLANKAVTDDAAHAFHRALDVDPHDARARYFLAVRQDLAGDHRGAVDAWIAVVKDSPPAAPWVGSVRALIDQVAGKYHIDVAGRLPAADSVAPADGLNGEAVATATIPGPDGSQMAQAARLSPSDQDRMVQGMIDHLTARLAADPHNAAGWIQLMRAHAAYGDKAAARSTLARARTAFTGDPATIRQLDLAAQALSIGS